MKISPASGGAVGTALAVALTLSALVFPQGALADPPTFTSTQSDILVEASDALGAIVEFDLPTAIDDNGDPFVDCDPGPGDLFPVGTTRVTCIAEDLETGELSAPLTFSVHVLERAQERASSGAVAALFYYRRTRTGYGDVRLTIIRDGEVVLAAPVPRYRTMYPVNPAGYGERPSVFVRDLDGDQEPEVLLDLFWGGAHCCFWSNVYRYSPGTYLRASRFWGDVSYRLVDVDRDGRPEFRSADGRFAYAFTAYAFSGFPIQIWSYAGGRFTDVTREFPADIRGDAAGQWHRYRSLRRQRYEVRGALAAWAADKCLLHHGARAFRRLRQLAAKGELSRSDGPDSTKVYLRKLRRTLRRFGYCRGTG
jgi:hypothetical protein